MDQKDQGKVAGGKARAEVLSPERRSEIAKRAAESRWAATMPRALYGDEEHPLVIGDMEIPCYVLDDERRVLITGGMQDALKMARGGSMVRGMNRFELFASRKAINPYISNDLMERIRHPINFLTPRGNRAHGYEAEVLVELCEAILAARADGKLQKQQEGFAAQAELIMRGLARVGIVALVDEATGYQRDRAADALAQILEKFIAKELQPWVRTFPDVYYEEMFRLRGLQFPTDTVKRPQYFGHLTNDLIYKRLAPGVLEELQRSTPKLPSGKRKHHMHRKLTPDMGHPKLREHLASVTTIMRLSNDYEDFKAKMDRLHPRYGQTLPLDLDGEGL